MKIPALVGKKDFDNVFKNSDTSFSSYDAILVVKNKIEEFDKLKVKKNFIDLESKIEKI